MSNLCSVTVNGTAFSAYAGDCILDAALLNGVDLPHDCRSGKCGACLVRVVDGHTLGGASHTSGMVHACQAVVVSDLVLASEETPDVLALDGTVKDVRRIVSDVFEVTIAIEEPLTMLPGQYCRLTFDGFPSRLYSPTVALDGHDWRGSFRLHIKLVPGGQVSSELGAGIGRGHPVRIEGPYGQAFLRRGKSNRLVLFSSGTGFAPVWAIADAALREDVNRRIVVVASAASLDRLYMAEALTRLATCPNVVVLPVTPEGQQITPLVRTGRPTDFAHIITADDIVYAAGAPEMVEAIGAATAAARAMFYADPFLPSSDDTPTRPVRAWFGAVAERLHRRPAKRPALPLGAVSSQRW
jgi:3-phenylpropionate/trans-cinnamate dioxygenase ferredoxin reductase subunit